VDGSASTTPTSASVNYTEALFDGITAAGLKQKAVPGYQEWELPLLGRSIPKVGFPLDNDG
jgi:hypothetical protein